jgi:hypothetical protein
MAQMMMRADMRTHGQSVSVMVFAILRVMYCMSIIYVLLVIPNGVN